VSCYVSVDDLFTAGLGFDLAGAVLLGVGLLLSHSDVARRAATYWDESAVEAVSLARSRVDAMIGFASLALGFICQAAAYAAILGGVGEAQRGWRASIVAIATGIAAAGVVIGLWLVLRSRWVKASLIEVAHYDAVGNRKRWPSLAKLKQYAFALGEAVASEEVGQGETRRFVQRVFGVDYAVTDAYLDDPAPPSDAFDED
jgi:hypothetical protein